MDVNKVTLIGRLTAKPEATELPAGQRTASFSLATTTKGKATELHRVVVGGTLAEVVLRYLDKGSRVYLEGQLVQRQGSNTRTTTEVVADEIILLATKPARSDKPQAVDA